MPSHYRKPSMKRPNRVYSESDSRARVIKKLRKDASKRLADAAGKKLGLKRPGEKGALSSKHLRKN